MSHALISAAELAGLPVLITCVSIGLGTVIRWSLAIVTVLVAVRTENDDRRETAEKLSELLIGSSPSLRQIARKAGRRTKPEDASAE